MTSVSIPGLVKQNKREDIVKLKFVVLCVKPGKLSLPDTMTNINTRKFTSSRDKTMGKMQFHPNFQE